MWIFRSKTKNCYLAANPKVLTQTLLRQKNLARFTSKRRYLHFLLKELSVGAGPEYIMLVRNPYKRVESYFREKLRQKVRLVFGETPYILKRHQAIFYPYIGLTEQDSLQQKHDRLLALDFKSFIRALPDVFAVEDHLAPQTRNFTRSILGRSFTMKMNRYVRIERKDEMSELANYLGLDLSIRLNSSAEVSETLEWDRESIEIIKKIYADDFKTFGYSPELPADLLKRDD